MGNRPRQGGVYFVQVRFAGDRQWTTVGAGDGRSAAARRAGVIFEQFRSGSGSSPDQVRVLSEATLTEEAGVDAVGRAFAEMALLAGQSG